MKLTTADAEVRVGHFCSLHFDVILTSVPRLHVWSLPLSFCSQYSVCILYFPIKNCLFSHFIICDLIAVIE